MAGTSPAMTPHVWFNLIETRSSAGRATILHIGMTFVSIDALRDSCCADRGERFLELDRALDC